MKTLVIVESPAKAKTINKYLGPDYIVEASIGHVKDLPREGLSIDVEEDFRATYEIIRGKEDVVKRLQQLAERCSEVFLATDPDREGEAIAHHIAQEISPRNSRIRRVLFNEITKAGVTAAMNAPRDIDQDMVHAQEARRVMDRLIGYKVSPFLWKTFRGESRGLSAGRVQSVALRLVVERERAINSFIPIEYWSLVGRFRTGRDEEIVARLVRADGLDIRNPSGSAVLDKREFDRAALTAADEETLPRMRSISSRAEAEELRERALREEYAIASITKKEVRRGAPEPFTTSTLQQEASRKLRMNPQRTMKLAQNLYEGAEIGARGRTGLITYMRTDSTRVSDEARDGAEAFIYENYGKEYLPLRTDGRGATPKSKPRAKAVKAQDAHEAIRPTDVRITPKEARKHLDREAADLYELIWSRFVASCMATAILDQTTVDIEGGPFLFRATGRVVRFRGWQQVYDDVDESKERKSKGKEGDDDDGQTSLPPNMRRGEPIALEALDTKHSATRPPVRYTESLLIKEMEAKGIGRPSTYASIIATIQDRGYVEQIDRRLHATDLGMKVSDALVAGFPTLFDIRFTAKMEGDLDTIAGGRNSYLKVVQGFYRPLEQALAKVGAGGRRPARPRNAPMIARQAANQPGEPLQLDNAVAPPEEKTMYCPQCNAPMRLRSGREGSEFYGCTRYPECRGTRPVPLGVTCPSCAEGDVVARTGGRYNGVFYACSRYPDCRFTSSKFPINKPCPSCDSTYLVYVDSPTGGRYVECPKCRSKIDAAL